MLPIHFIHFLVNFSLAKIFLLVYIYILDKVCKVQFVLTITVSLQFFRSSTIHHTQSCVCQAKPSQQNQVSNNIIGSSRALIKKRLIAQPFFSYPQLRRDLQTCCTAKRKNIQKWLVFGNQLNPLDWIQLSASCIKSHCYDLQTFLESKLTKRSHRL